VGPSTAKNIGVCYAEEDLIAFIDAHCYVNNCYVENVKEIFKDKRKILVRGKILPINCSTVIPPRFYDIGNQAIPIIPTIGGNLVIRKRDFMRIGGFEDPLYGQECIVIAHRMLNFYDYEEEELYYDPRLVLYHDFEKIENKEKEKREKYMLKTILENYQNIQETYDKLDYTLNLITRVDNIKSKEILLHKQKKLENSRLYKILKLYYASKGNIGNIIKFPILAFKILFNKSQSPVSSDS
jgi:glycosyltransferase involved in cell wall biosynthesis